MCYSSLAVNVLAQQPHLLNKKCLAGNMLNVPAQQWLQRVCKTFHSTPTLSHDD